MFFTLLSLSTGGVQNFSVVALAGAHGVSFAAATAALTAWLTLSALGVLAGGIVADRTRRHGEVAAAGFGGTAALVLLVALVPLPDAVLIATLGLAGFLSGTIMPSRDMLVRAAVAARRHRPRLRRRHHRLQHRRRARADALWLAHGPRPAARRVPRRGRVHGADDAAGAGAAAAAAAAGRTQPAPAE